MKLTTLRALHVATDALLVSLGWLAAYGMRYALAEPIGRAINPFDGYLRALPIVVVPWIATCWWFGIYRSRRTHTAVDELSKLLRGAMLGLLVLAAVGFFFKELAFGRLVVLASAGMNLVFQGASRMFFHRLERNLRRSGSSDLRVLIVGTGVPAIRLLQKLQDHPEDGYRVVGLLDDAPELPEKDVAGHSGARPRRRPARGGDPPSVSRRSSSRCPRSATRACSRSCSRARTSASRSASSRTCSRCSPRARSST